MDNIFGGGIGDVVEVWRCGGAGCGVGHVPGLAQSLADIIDPRGYFHLERRIPSSARLLHGVIL